MRKITHIIIHHSLSKDGKERNWGAIRKYHVKHNGWSDIGYHLGIEQVDGAVGSSVIEAYGRPLEIPGAHVKGMNKHTIGICVVGNFDKQAPSEDKLEMLQWLIEDLVVLYKVPIKNVLGHWEAQKLQGIPKSKRKSCPGKMFDMKALRANLKKRGF